jgi:hypothetical protein
MGAMEPSHFSIPQNPIKGMGALNFDGSGLLGSGVFGSTVNITDLSTWTWAEYVTAGLGVYVIFAVFSTTKQTATKASRRAKRISQGFTS